MAVTNTANSNNTNNPDNTSTLSANLAAISRAHATCASFYQELTTRRNETVILCNKEGMTVSDIATITGLNQRYIYEIINQKKS